MQTFLELDIPLVGYSRPSILLLLNIQDGINEGYFYLATILSLMI